MDITFQAIEDIKKGDVCRINFKTGEIDKETLQKPADYPIQLVEDSNVCPVCSYNKFNDNNRCKNCGSIFPTND